MEGVHKWGLEATSTAPTSMQKARKLTPKSKILCDPASSLTAAPTPILGGEIELGELIKAMWHDKWVIAAITLVFALAAMVYASAQPDIYQSQTLLAPSEDAQGGGIAKMAGQLGGLASLAGISVGPNTGADKVAIAVAVMRSRSFIKDFIERYDMLPELMAVERWLPQENRIVFDENKYLSGEKKWVRKVGFPFEARPSSWEAYDAFMQILSVYKEKDTGFVTVSIGHQSPYLAAEWVKNLVKDVNAVMRNKDVKEAQRSVEFLEAQSASVALAEMRTVFYQLIEEQTKTIMLAEVRDEYVFTTIDPPVVAQVKSGPRRTVIAVLGVVIGGIVAVIIVLMKFLYGSQRAVDSDNSDQFC